MVAATAAPTRPPANIEGFLWNIHQVLAAQPGPLPIDELKEVYSKQLGHKCAIERFLVVGEGGLSATLKRIPHIVTLSISGGATLVKATQPADTTKQQLIEADAAYRRELIKKNAAAKAKAVATKASASSPPPGTCEQPPAAKAATSVPGQADAAKRPAEGQAAPGDAKKARTKNGSDSDILARMLVQGVVRVLQNRQKAGKGPLPVAELEKEFTALWKVPLNLQQVNETDAVSFLQKWPNKVEILQESGQDMLQLSKKTDAKAKTAAPAKAGVEAAATATKMTGAGAKAAAPPPVPGRTAAPSTAAKGGSPAAPAAATKSPSPVAEATPSAAKSAPAGAAVAKERTGAPSRPPASIEDFLWNIHSVIEAFGAPMPVDQMKDAYSQHLGHKCAIERFLVVGDGGLVATLKRIPHIVTVLQDKDGNFNLTPTLPVGTTKESLIAADLEYRKQLQQKNAAAKEAAAKVTPAVPSPTSSPPMGESSAAALATSTTAKAAAPPSMGQKRQAESASGDGDIKKSRQDEADTLPRMLVQGIVRLLQNRQKAGKGPLPLESLEEEFKALWKVPFNFQQAGETDIVTFLRKWPNKVDVVGDGKAVQLAKKTAEKAKATTSGSASPPLLAKPGIPTPIAEREAAAAASEGLREAFAVLEDEEMALAASSASTAEPAAESSGRPPAPAAATSSKDASPTSLASSTRDNGFVAPTIMGEVTPRTLPEIRAQAEGMLQSMQDMLQRQEALVNALRQLGDAAAP